MSNAESRMKNESFVINHLSFFICHMVISKDAEKKTMELLQLYVKKGEIAFPGEKSRKPRNYQTNLRSAHKQRVFQF
jgi:hypothetical protein